MAHAEIDPYMTDVLTGICVQTTWNEKPLIEQVPGSRWDANAQTWRVPLSYTAAVTLRGLFGPTFTYGPTLTEWLWNERRTRVDPATFLRDKVEWPDEWPVIKPGTFAEPTDGSRLRPFQEVGALWLLTGVDVVLGDDMGTGKTVQILSALHVLSSAGRGLPAVVICPNGVKRHWARLAGLWCPLVTPYVVAGTATQRDKILKAAHDDPTAMVIINIEAARLFSRLAPYGSVKLKRCRQCSKHGEDITPSRCEVHPKILNNFGFKTAVLDEAHHVQNPQSKWTRAVWAIMHQPTIEHHWGATGTIIGDHPGDAWAIMHAVCRVEYPMKSKWMDRYALMSWTSGGGTDVVGLRPDTRAEFFTYFDPRFRRMTQRQVLPQLPPCVRITRLVEMTPGQRRMYSELDKRLQTRTDSGELLIAPDNLVAQTRLMQLSAATVEVVEKPDPDDLTTWSVKLREPCPKLDELEKVIRELGDDQFVVAAEYRDLIDMASARLMKMGIRHGFVTGGQSEFERDQQLQLLREGRIRALLFTIKAGSEGVDMSAASTLITLQRSWRMIHDQQMIKRVLRFGSTRHRLVRIIDIVTEDTVEVPQMTRIMQKFERLEEINRDRETLRRAGIDTAQLDREAQEILNSYVGTP